MHVVHVLGNRTSRSGSDALDAVHAALSRRDVDTIELTAGSRDEAAAAASVAVDAGAERLIAVGGDGVVNIAGNAVAETDTVLGIVPDGTGNDFARALGLLDGSLDDQVERALDGPAPVDAIRTDHGWVTSVATLGFSGDVTARANGLRWPKGQRRYAAATLLQLPRLRTLPVECTVDGKHFSSTTTLLAIGNTAYFGGGMRICPDASHTDGRMHVVNIAAVSRWRFMRVFPTVFSGRHVGRPEVTSTTGSSVRLSGADVDLWADGERLGSLPVALEVVPGALRVAGV